MVDGTRESNGLNGRKVIKRMEIADGVLLVCMPPDQEPIGSGRLTLNNFGKSRSVDQLPLPYLAHMGCGLLSILRTDNNLRV